MMHRVFRWSTQALGLLLVLVAPALTLWGVGSTTRYSHDEMAHRYSAMGLWVRDAMHRWMGEPPTWVADALVGGPWSVRVAGVELTDPLALLHTIWGGALPPVATLLGVAVALGFYMLFGRAFCGYLCPYGTLSRWINRLRRPLARRGWVLHLEPPRWGRWVVVGALVVLPAMGASVAPYFLPYLLVGATAHGALFGSALGAGSVLVASLLADLLLFEHGMCRAVCPSGALQGVVGAFRVLRLGLRPRATCQAGCGSCATTCWLGLEPRAAKPGLDCDGCGRCVPVCPNSRLKLHLTLPRLAALLLVFAVAGCDAPGPPVVLSTASVWSSPFMPPADQERKVEVAIHEVTVDGLNVGVGTSFDPDLSADINGLRVWLESAPGEPWKGPLTVRLVNAAGEVDLMFAKANTPRSVPDPSIYEATVSVHGAAELIIIDGPSSGVTVQLPRQPGALTWWPILPSVGVVLFWVVGMLARPSRASADRREPT